MAFWQTYFFLFSSPPFSFLFVLTSQRHFSTHTKTFVFSVFLSHLSFCPSLETCSRLSLSFHLCLFFLFLFFCFCFFLFSPKNERTHTWTTRTYISATNFIWKSLLAFFFIRAHFYLLVLLSKANDELKVWIKMSILNRFDAIEEGVDNLCFLCLQVSNSFCERCGLAYCSESHFLIHRQNDSECFPFRVLQKPEVLWLL